MTSQHELLEAANAFIEGSDNLRQEECQQSIFGLRGRGYMFEYSDFVNEPVAMVWSPLVEDGVFIEHHFSGYKLENFITQCANAAGKIVVPHEVTYIADTIKARFPEIEVPPDDLDV